jgi:hypothetical protein
MRAGTIASLLLLVVGCPAYAQTPEPKSMTIFATIGSGGGDMTISWPWGSSIQEYAKIHPGSAQPAQVASHPIPDCAWINRVYA